MVALAVATGYSATDYAGYSATDYARIGTGPLLMDKWHFSET